MARRTVKVPPEKGGARLDQFLVSALPGISISRARALLSTGRVRIRGKVAKTTRKLWGGEEVEVDLPSAEPVRGTGAAPLSVLASTRDVVIVNKPAGVVVEPDGHNESIVQRAAESISGIDVSGSALPGVVHRLDRDTTGCLALARTEAGIQQMQAAFLERRVEKIYLALVLGDPPESARLEGAYGRDPKNPRLYTTRVKSARRAALAFRVRERLAQGCALLEVSLETGRTHQIRVQLSEAGLPLLADPLYGPKEVREHPAALALGRLALHAEQLAVTSLTPGVNLAARAPLPEDFQRALAVLSSSQCR